MEENRDNGSEVFAGNRWYEEDSPWKAKNIFKIIEKNNLSPKSVCEIGCGSGEVLRDLASYFDSSTKFVGYETSAEAYTVCKTKEEANIQYELANLLALDVYYDLVMAINVLDHVADYLGFLSQLRSKGEYKVFHIPLETTIYSVLRSTHFEKRIAEGIYKHSFSKDTALGTLKGTGYEIVDYFYTSSALELPNLGSKDKFWKLPRKLLYAINNDFGVKVLGGFSLMVLAK